MPSISACGAGGPSYSCHSPPSTRYSTRLTPDPESSAVSVTRRLLPEPLTAAVVVGASASTSTVSVLVSSWFS